jgi:hypothetical protein
MCTDAGVKFTAWLACQIVSGKCTIATDVYGNRSRAFTYSAPGLKRDNLVNHLILGWKTAEEVAEVNPDLGTTCAQRTLLRYLRLELAERGKRKSGLQRKPASVQIKYCQPR